MQPHNNIYKITNALKCILSFEDFSILIITFVNKRISSVKTKIGMSRFINPYSDYGFKLLFWLVSFRSMKSRRSIRRFLIEK